MTAQVSTGVRLADENQVRVLGSEGYLVVEDPWFGGDGKPTHVTVHKVGEEPRDISAEPALHLRGRGRGRRGGGRVGAGRRRR